MLRENQIASRFKRRAAVAFPAVVDFPSPHTPQLSAFVAEVATKAE